MTRRYVRRKGWPWKRWPWGWTLWTLFGELTVVTSGGMFPEYHTGPHVWWSRFGGWPHYDGRPRWAFMIWGRVVSGRPEGFRPRPVPKEFGPPRE